MPEIDSIGYGWVPKKEVYVKTEHFMWKTGIFVWVSKEYLH